VALNFEMAISSIGVGFILLLPFLPWFAIIVKVRRHTVELLIPVEAILLQLAEGQR
jgi:hypothetical protein